MTQAACWFRFWLEVFFFFRDKLSIRKDEVFLNEIKCSFKWSFTYPVSKRLNTNFGKIIEISIFLCTSFLNVYHIIENSISFHFHNMFNWIHFDYIVKHVFFIRFIFILAMLFPFFLCKCFCFCKTKNKNAL